MAYTALVVGLGAGYFWFKYAYGYLMLSIFWFKYRTNETHFYDLFDALDDPKIYDMLPHDKFKSYKKYLQAHTTARPYAFKILRLYYREFSKMAGIITGMAIVPAILFRQYAYLYIISVCFTGIILHLDRWYRQQYSQWFYATWLLMVFLDPKRQQDVRDIHIT